MILSLIVAADEHNAIGINNTLPWHLPDDLKFFKRNTLGKPIIMGRKTYESLGKPLPGRLNVVLSRDANLRLPEGVLLFADLKSAVAHVTAAGVEEAMILGGGEIFRQAMPTADRLWLTRVHTTVPGTDTFFPSIDHTHWKLTWHEQHEADEKHKYAFTFECYERIEL
jgi:dihydrofolate reductase